MTDMTDDELMRTLNSAEHKRKIAKSVYYNAILACDDLYLEACDRGILDRLSPYGLSTIVVRKK